VNATVFVNDQNSSVKIAANGKASIDLNTTGNDQDYNFAIRLVDGANNSSPTLHTLITKDTQAPVFVSATSVSVDENQQDAVDVNANDGQGNDYNVTYSIIAGDDQAKFSIVASTGVLTFSTAPDYENALDSDTNNIYLVTVKAVDLAGNESNQSISVTVTDVDETNLIISSAMYDTQRTASANDDILYIYFNKAIDEGSVNDADPSNNYTITGTGAIGSSSLAVYSSANFYQHKITLNSDGTTSTAFVPNATTIAIASEAIEDSNGDYPSSYPSTLVKNITLVMKTGQVDVNVSNDDGDYQQGLARSYTRNGTDNTDFVVVDNSTGLTWQDNNESNTTSLTYDGAVSYCDNLVHATQNDWRLPTLNELATISDFGAYEPAMNATFVNTSSTQYWSQTEYNGDNTQAWYIHFEQGYSHYNIKTGTLNVRCVRGSEY
jgi:hypothetical protein